MTHEQAYSDHCYLWGIGAADDMTGGYVDQEDLAKLLKTPNKRTATKCLCDQIGHWFSAGIDSTLRGDTKTVQDLIDNDKIVREIADRHGYL